MRRVGRLEEARKKLDQLTEKGLVPDVVTYNILINGLCMKGMKMEADKLLVQMEEKGCFPEPISFNTVIQGFLVENETDRAMQLIEKMCYGNFLPNEQVTSMLLELHFVDSQ